VNAIKKWGRYKLYRYLVKSIFDRLFAFALLAFLSPVFLIVGLLLFFFQGRQVLFFQERPGIQNRLFLVVKFKTMSDEVDIDGNLLPDAKRLTSIGKFVRRTSLDELPQLWNVLVGDMSFVGPRPLLIDYLPLYSQVQKRRHDVLPGITGWAQVNGRNGLPWKERFEHDVWYVDHQSFLLDLKILLITVERVFKAKNINSSSGTTMEKFEGNDR
jgi:undecaprenyl phosphate N,N'-diacetylbacillosamine 1-phosphate transferase